jgi:hypothetical protein
MSPAESARIRSMLSAAALLCSPGCNAIFGIEEGVLDENVQLGPPVDPRDRTPTTVRVDEEVAVIRGAIVSHSRGLNGSLWTVKAPLGASIDPDCVNDPGCFQDQTEAEACATGTVEPVLDDDFANRWGANLQLNLLPSLDRLATGVRGVAFTVWGENEVLPSLRFLILTPSAPGVPAPSSCLEWQPVNGVQSEILFDQLRSNCHMTGAMGVPPSPAVLLTTLVWQVDAEASVAKPFDFCISDIHPIIVVP